LAQRAECPYADSMPRVRKAGSAKKTVAKRKAAARPNAAKRTAKAVVRAAAGRRGQRAGLSAEHKAQLARGREEARVVRAYLDTIDTGPKRPGRRRTPESLAKQIAQVNERLRGARGLDKLNLLKDRRDLESARANLVPTSDQGALERDFVRVARRYGERRGIDYSIWREAGVPAAVLTKARVPRTRIANSRKGAATG
jgi:hypothetical protein